MGWGGKDRTSVLISELGTFLQNSHSSVLPGDPNLPAPSFGPTYFLSIADHTLTIILVGLAGESLSEGRKEIDK